MSFKEAEIIRKRAEAFLRNAERLLTEGEWDLAAFNLEQYCQLILKYKLLTRTGSYPRTHSLIRLLRELGRLSKREEAEKFIERNVLYLTKIEDAYIGARYLPRRYEEAEVRQLLRFVEEEFAGFVREL